jgi:CheY-like chemotaxis protein/nitrogen-specific signal transduction histidine kinase
MMFWGRKKSQDVQRALALGQAKDKAEQALAAQTRFLASATHDLRQPAHAMAMLVGRLKYLPLDAQSQAVVAHLDASVHELGRMLDSLLDLTKLDAGSVQATLVATPLNEVLQRLELAIGPSAQAKGLRLRIRPSPFWAMTDVQLLERVVLNLAHNAVRYTDQGSIFIGCRRVRNASALRIDVCDSGVGISTENQEKIFQAYVQAPAVTNAATAESHSASAASQGHGLGLHIVERLAQFLGVKVELRSAPRCGSRFSITLPLATPLLSSQTHAEHLNLELGMASMAGRNVLVVEDDPLVCESLCDLLTSWGCNVVSKASAEQAYAWLRQQGEDGTQHVELIISDHDLGAGDNGMQMIVKIRAHTRPDFPAIMVSGDTSETLKAQTHEAGIPLLYKPVKPAYLRTLLGRVLKA